MNRCVIFGGGEIEDLRLIRRMIQPTDYIICADSGYACCTSLGIVPHLVLGDFDSYRGDVAKQCELLRFPVEKDDTDTMLAVKEAISRGYTDIIMFGMMGGRLDHTIANIQTLAYGARRGASLCMYDKSCFITMVSSGQRITVPCRERFTLSVFCYTEKSCGVTLQQVQYPLEGSVLTSDFPLGVSNHFLPGEDAVISVEEGLLLVVCNKENG